LALSWGIVKRGSSRRDLGIVVVVLSVLAAAYVGTACAQTGGFRSVHILGVGTAIMIFPCLGAMNSMEATVGSLGAVGVWMVTTLSTTIGPVGWPALVPDLLYLSAICALAILAVHQGRQTRIGQFVASRRAQALHRFAVEEVLCRHLPPSYVEQVLSGERSIAAPPERRMLTILFADVVDFSKTAAASEPEELAEVMAKYYDIAARKAFEFGGTVDKFIGDAVMVLFGAPDGMEPPLQAFQALQFAQALHTATADLALPGGRGGTRLRVGIHQDVVIVGNFGGSLRLDFTALGFGVNLAARLQQQAPKGSILLSEALYNRLEPQIQAQGESKGLVKYKGIDREVQTWAYDPALLTL
jgi:class 3 adenylate cyclase